MIARRRKGKIMIKISLMFIFHLLSRRNEDIFPSAEKFPQTYKIKLKAPQKKFKKLEKIQIFIGKKLSSLSNSKRAG